MEQKKPRIYQYLMNLYSLAGFLMALVATIIIIVFVALETFTGLEIHIWACSSILPFQVC